LHDSFHGSLSRYQANQDQCSGARS
jgi:hypothetical protein